MGGKEIGNWVSAYLDKNLDLLVRLTQPREEQETSCVNNESLEEDNNPLNREIMEDEVDRAGSLVKLETDADPDMVAFHWRQADEDGKVPYSDKETSEWTEPEAKRVEDPEHEEKKRKIFSLRDDPLRLVCGWWFCGQEFPEWSPFQDHVVSHLKEVNFSSSLRKVGKFMEMNYFR